MQINKKSAADHVADGLARKPPSQVCAQASDIIEKTHIPTCYYSASELVSEHTRNNNSDTIPYSLH